MNRAICVICLEDLWASDKQVVSYSCGHVHHAGCVQRITHCPCCRRPLENRRSLFVELVPDNLEAQQNLNDTGNNNLIPIRGVTATRIGQDIQYNLPLFQMAPGNDMDIHQFYVNLRESNLWRQIYITIRANQIRVRVSRDRNHH